MKYVFLFAALVAASAAEANTLPNVVFLTVDTLRADYLGAYGFPSPTTPTLDRLAEDALLFEDVVCETPLTSPSFCAMLSARYPRMTGTTRNGLRMPPGVPLVAEQFQAAGYHTFCVQSNWTLKDKLSGLARGFDIYDDDFHKKRWGFMKAERDGDEVTELALKYLEGRPTDAPFFAWIHYSDPHAPYKMHKGFHPSGKRTWHLDNEEKTRVKYASEVAFTDHQIEQILSALPENTTVVFVGDHGESLHDHGYLGHGRRIYQTTMHVPLIIRAEGVAAGRSDVPARGIDVGPTLLGLANLPIPEGMLGKNLLQDTIHMNRVRVVETYGGAVPNLPGVKSAMADAAPIRRGVLHEGWKLILGGDGDQLFYLPEDPEELQNRAASEPARVDEMKALIGNWEDATPVGAKGEENLNADDLRALESLGYLE